MDDRTRPDTNVVLLRRKGDPGEVERERVASTIFAEPDDVATFSRGNLVPPRPDARDANGAAPSPDPFFDRLRGPSQTDEAQQSELAGDRESTDAYFDRLASQSPAEMTTNGGPASAATPMPGSALLPAELARPCGRRARVRGRLIPSALTIRLWDPLRRSRFARSLSAATAAALIAGIAVIGESGLSGSGRQPSQREAKVSFLERLKPDILAALANPLGATVLVDRSVTRVRRPHPSTPGRPKSHRAGTRISGPVHTTVKPRVVTATYTPARTSTTVAVTPDTQSSTATRSTPPTTQPVAPTHYTSSSNSGSGSSSGSTSPSRATLRSLVTGAGQCSC